MATLPPVPITDDWTLVYDASASGGFVGSVNVRTGEIVAVRISSDAPTPSDPGMSLGYSFPVALSEVRSDKLYMKAYDGSASVILDRESTAPSAFPVGLLSSDVEGVRRLRTDSQPAAFWENKQYRFFEDLSLLNAGNGVPANSQLVYKISSTNDFVVFLRQINIWQGGRKYSVIPADGNESFTGTEVDISDQIYPTNGILNYSLPSIPSSGVTITRAIGPGIFSSPTLPRNGTAALTDGNANRASSAYTANGDQGGVAAGQSFYLVFDHIGASNATLGLFLIAFALL